MTRSIADTMYSLATQALSTARDAGNDGHFLYELEQLKAAAAAVDVATRTAIITARANGASWADVGVSLGISKQAAWERYGRD